MSTLSFTAWAKQLGLTTRRAANRQLTDAEMTGRRLRGADAASRAAPGMPGRQGTALGDAFTARNTGGAPPLVTLFIYIWPGNGYIDVAMA
jgi:hypothetical protein